MAEQVQAVLDSMVAPLRDLLERNIFSESEIRAIVARRKHSEYLVRRRTTRKADFLRYIDDELQLEELRKLRMKMVGRRTTAAVGNKQSAATNASSKVGDRHIVRHLHFLFTRLLRKFKSDLSLYLQYMEFCKSTGSLKTLGNTYAQALRVHPRHVGLWIEAASHECFAMGSVANARVLLQTALRIHNNNNGSSCAQDLWLQYFALELHHVQKLRGRREILQLTSSAEPRDDNETDHTTNDNLTIPTIVYRNAIEAIPDSVVFRLKFLDQCHMFPSTTNIQTFVMETIARDFDHDVDAWIARAAFASSSGDSTVSNDNDNDDDDEEDRQVGFVVTEKQEQSQQQRSSKRLKTMTTGDAQVDSTISHHPIVKVLEEAIEVVPTAEMYVKSIQFVRSYLNNQTDTSTETEEEEILINFVHKLLRDASTREIASAELALEGANVWLQEGKLKEARDVLKAFAMSSAKMESVSVWVTWANLCHASDQGEMLASQVLRMALERTPLYSSKEHMMLLLELFGALLTEYTTTLEGTASGDSPDETGGTHDAVVKYKSELIQLLEKMLLLSAGSVTAPFQQDECVFGIQSVAAASLRYVRFSASLIGGIHAARSVYEQVLYRSNCYGSSASSNGKIRDDELQHLKEFMDECIALEQKETATSKVKKQRLGRLYEAAITVFDESNPSLADWYRSQRDSNVRFA